MTQAVSVPSKTQQAELSQPFQTETVEHKAWLTELDRLPMNALNAELIQERDTTAKAFLERVRKSKLQEAIDGAHKAHKMLTDIRTQLTSSAQSFRLSADRWLSRYRLQERAKAEAKRRAQEAEARKQAEDARIAEAAALEAQGRQEEAVAVLEAPPAPISIPMDDSAGKVNGRAEAEVWRPQTDAKNNVIFESPQARCEFFLWAATGLTIKDLTDAGIPATRIITAFNECLEAQYSPLKKLLTSNRGVLQPPGLVIEYVIEGRNRAME